MALTRRAHLVCICAENSVIMCGSEFELIIHLVAELVSVRLARASRHTYSSKGVYSSLKRCVCLRTHDKLKVFVNVAGGIASKR